jgi:uridine kinase
VPASDNRVNRRIVRDSLFRGYTASDTLKQWKSVRAGETKNIFPYQESADVMYNSALFYELSVLKLHAERQLLKVPYNHPQYAEAQRLLRFLSFFLPLQTTDVPKNSILKEFIGGSSFRY